VAEMTTKTMTGQGTDRPSGQQQCPLLTRPAAAAAAQQQQWTTGRMLATRRAAAAVTSHPTLLLQQQQLLLLTDLSIDCTLSAAAPAPHSRSLARRVFQRRRPIDFPRPTDRLLSVLCAKCPEWALVRQCARKPENPSRSMHASHSTNNGRGRLNGEAAAVQRFVIG